MSPMGPFTPPTPAEADQVQGEPMAVAADKMTRHGEGFLPTTAARDQMAPDVARKWRDPQLQRGTRGGNAHPTPHGAPVEGRTDENRRAERPEGYTEVDENGWRHLEGEQD